MDGVVDVEKVRPSLRFLLEPEATAEAEQFRRHVMSLALGTRTPEQRLRWSETYFHGGLPKMFPYVARADEAVGGLVSECMRWAAWTGGLEYTGYPYVFADVAARPDRLKQGCESLLGRAREIYGTPPWERDGKGTPVQRVRRAPAPRRSRGHQWTEANAGEYHDPLFVAGVGGWDDRAEADFEDALD